VAGPFAKPFRLLRFGAPIVVVSGLPRSGTSMVMGMLAAGGLELMTDGVRVADESNPAGYFEYERVKTLDKGGDKTWLESVRGKGIKIISFLLRDLPDTNSYRVIFLDRAMDEILRSQQKMLQASGAPADPAQDERIAAGFRDHIRTVKAMLAQRPCFEVLELNHADVLNRPVEQAARIERFVGAGLDGAKMAAIVDRALYRNRR
jgi:hypothetical protein